MVKSPGDGHVAILVIALLLMALPPPILADTQASAGPAAEACPKTLHGTPRGHSSECCCPGPIVIAAPPAASDDAGGLKVLEQVGTVSTLAIEAAKSSAASTGDTYQTFAAFLAGGLSFFVGLFGFLGWKTLKDAFAPQLRIIADEVQRVQALRAQAEKMLEEVQALAGGARTSVAELKLRTERIGELQEEMRNLSVDTLEISRKLLVVRTLKAGDPDERTLFGEMLPLLDRAIPTARGMELWRLLAWCLSMRALVASKSGRWVDAERDERSALELSLTRRGEGPDQFPNTRVAEMHYNLACWLARQNRLDDARRELDAAQALNEKSFNDAKGDPDLEALFPQPDA